MKWRYVKQYKVLYLFLLPAFVVTLIFSYLPMAGLVMAFQDYKAGQGFTGSEFVGLVHFREFLNDPDFYRALKNTLVMNGLIILIGFPLPIIFALLLNEIRNAIFKRITQTISYLPYFISWVVVGGLAYKILEMDSGSFNLLLDWLGYEKIPFFREADYFWGIMTSLFIWKNLGWNSIIFLAALSMIDPEQYEAATVDGAGRYRKLMYITLPGIAPVIGLMFIFTVATIVGAGGGASFDAIYNLSNPLVFSKASTLDYFIYLEGIRSAQYSFAAAVGMFVSLVSLAIVMISNGISKKISGYGAY